MQPQRVGLPGAELQVSQHAYALQRSSTPARYSSLTPRLQVKSALESAYPALGLRARAIGSVGAKRQSLKCNGGAKARSN